MATVPRLVAWDAAGNQAEVNVPAQTFASYWRTRTFAVNDASIRRMVTPIIENTPGLKMPATPLGEFLLVNGHLRRVDAGDFVHASHDTMRRFLWRGAFLRLPLAAVEARFADHRFDIFDGRAVQRDYHLRYDLVSVQHAPIPAANSRRVLWAHYFGIYGIAVLIDHGTAL
ncbi:MAG: hypothetical protein ACRD2E_01665 [Terriglobales bacterium]